MKLKRMPCREEWSFLVISLCDLPTDVPTLALEPGADGPTGTLCQLAKGPPQIIRALISHRKPMHLAPLCLAGASLWHMNS